MESLWSNASLNGGANGCVATGAIQDSVKITSPGSQTSAVGASVNLAIQGSLQPRATRSPGALSGCRPA